ncbi:hypothetical protein [Polaribacter sp. Asnod1-A03]|uniref:hypothetical protein n=1 Tax=Polaribacter sp. Asnod1-A03 TaxID=3160581 RepID=UPI00386F4F84
MNKFLIGIIFLVIPFMSFAHNPLSAKYYLEATPSGSLLTINLSQSGINHLMTQKFSEEYFENIDEKAWKELIVNYIKEHFTLNVDGVKITLAKGGIRLGDHQTDLKFILPPLPLEPKNIFVHIPAFKENGKHQTIFAYNILGKVDKVILSDKNNFKADINLTSDTNVSESTTNYGWLLILFGGIILLVLIKVFKSFVA